VRHFVERLRRFHLRLADSQTRERLNARLAARSRSLDKLLEVCTMEWSSPSHSIHETGTGTGAVAAAASEPEGGS
jgi:hypothetical protein